MKILLVGNYPYLYSQSMDRFALLMLNSLKKLNHDVKLIKPFPLLGRLRPLPYGLGKWIGYLDRFFLFIPFLRRFASWADIIHICDQANAVYVPWIRHKPHILTCHDMIAIRSAIGEVAEISIGWPGKIYQRLICSGLRQAQRVVCVSKHTRVELCRIILGSPKRTDVVENSLNYPYSIMPADESELILSGNYAYPQRPYFLHVGGNLWYKNRTGVVKLFANLIRYDPFKNHHLILVGEPCLNELKELIKKSGLSNRIQEWQYATEQEMNALYCKAEALLFPSYIEGFGWPIIEAQASGCPVVTSNLEPMSDVGGSAAIYINPDRIEESSDMITKRLTTDREILVQKGLKNVSRFTQKKMLDGYLKNYQMVISESSS